MTRRQLLATIAAVPFLGWLVKVEWYQVEYRVKLNVVGGKDMFTLERPRYRLRGIGNWIAH